MIKKTRNPIERKLEIIRSATNFFKSKSYENTTMQDIMNDLGIAKGAIYHYFKSKEELFEAVVDDIVNNTILCIQTAMEQSQGNALEKIKLLSRLSNISSDNREILETLHCQNDIMHIKILINTLIKLTPIYANLIKQGCQEGIFKTETPFETAEFILFAVQFLTDYGIHNWNKQEIYQRAIAFPKIIEKLLSAPKGSFDFLPKHII